ncbi:SDR family NAD(P)-dependent oxidoreductase [Flavisphingomonas formosensis]|uniref:SDR family NAD(P)-dependent oxidoreductase n=1 Tax=Flavisphingomonas formosensis TaxID=861534 RepID=UPI0012F8D137|nr:SDR family NAD(P)-dependent oxidoreductase [Sphingomonas formosensis]
MDHALKVLVTGGNRGLGLGIASAYAERGDHVQITCRDASPRPDRPGMETIAGVEITDDAAMGRLGERIGAAPLDILVCNAGVNLDSPGLEGIDVANVAQVFDVNVLGCIRTVLAMLPHMAEKGKIMLIGSMGLLPLGILRTAPISNYGYRMSKAALVSFGHALAHEIAPRGIAVAIVSPGAVDTDMLRTVAARSGALEAARSSARDIFEAGRILRDRMDRLTLDHSPAYDRDPEGNAAIPEEIRQSLLVINSAQTAQAGMLAQPEIRS